MKKYIYILCAVLTAAFASCSQSEMGDETLQSKQTILKVVASDGLQTRGTATGVDRFAIEVYTDEAYTTAANVFADGTNKANNGNGEFAMVLDRTVKYYCLLWADKSGSSVYNINDLKAVALTGKAVEAWQGTKEIAAGTEAALTATLNRAVSKISLMETGKLKAGTLTLNLNQPTAFNVATAVTTGEATARPEESITIAAAGVDGSAAPTTSVKLNGTDIFVLSSVATADLTNLTFKYGTEDAFIVPQAPLKANFNTNIKGHYSTAKDGVTFTVTCDDAWGTPDNEPASGLKVGDYYPAGSTKDNAVGIVFWINPDDTTKGKIVSMDESGEVEWSDAKTWAESVTAGSLSWALPTKDELQYIWCAYNGASPVNWDKSTAPPCPAVDETKWGVFNDKLTSPFQKKYYWASTEAEQVGGENARWGATFTIGNTYGGVETMEVGRYARAVASF